MPILKRHDNRGTIQISEAEIGRTSVGTLAVTGDKVLVKEGESVMARESIDDKLAHTHWTGP